MDFRSPTVASQQNARTMAYLTDNLSNPKAGQLAVESLIEELGNAVDSYPDWHPILTLPPRHVGEYVSGLSDLRTYANLDHTRMFVKGFVTCPYSKDAADILVESVSKVPGLTAYRMEEPLYSDKAHPVVIAPVNLELEADGTIQSRDALAWFARNAVNQASRAEVAETWWTLRSHILGRPHGSRSSLFVNQHTGLHMRKILEAMNNSGMFGPIKEDSLDMLSQKKRDAISQTLIRAAFESWNKQSDPFTFEMRGETCKATLRDTWNDNSEITVRVEIGNFDLYVSGFYFPKDRRITHVDPRGQRRLAEKFL